MPAFASLTSFGCVFEIASWRSRAFLPSSGILTRVLSHSPVTSQHVSINPRSEREINIGVTYGQ